MPVKSEADLKLKQYDLLMQQNRFEHTSFWTRFGFMMVSQIALLGFFLNIVLQALKETSHLYLLFSLPLSIVGLILVWFFFRLHRITKWWIERWLKLIEGLESSAFGELKVVQGGRLEAPGSLRKVAEDFLIVFTVLWCLATAAVLIFGLCVK